MSGGTLLVCLFAILAIAAGALMVFRQRAVRRWWRALTGKAPGTAKPEGEDPAHYAMIVFGMMLLAFGLIILSFFSLFSLMT